MQARTDAGLTAGRIPQTVLVAPDSFKGTLSAHEVAGAVGDGLRAAGHVIELCPVADGGEGTLEVLLGALGGELRSARASDPLGRAIEASFGLCPVGRRLVGVVETASASGLGLVSASG